MKGATMSQLRRLALLVVCLTVVGCRQEPGKTPEDVAHQFVQAMGDGKLDEAERLFISRQEFVSLFSDPNLDDYYDQLAKRFKDSLNTLRPQMRGCEFVRINLAVEPSPLEPGRRFGPVRVRAKTLAFDNVHAVVLINGVERDLKLDELIKVDDSWRLVDAVSLDPGS